MYIVFSFVFFEFVGFYEEKVEGFILFLFGKEMRLFVKGWNNLSLNIVMLDYIIKYLYFF